MPSITNALDEARDLVMKRLAELDDERRRLERALTELGGKATRRPGRPKGSTSKASKKSKVSKKRPPPGQPGVAGVAAAAAPAPIRLSR